MEIKLNAAEVHSTLFALEFFDELMVLVKSRANHVGADIPSALSMFAGEIECSLVKLRASHTADRKVGVATVASTAKTARTAAQIMFGG